MLAIITFFYLESDQCSPNPCHNGGSCVTDGKTFTCACNGTGYGGPTCTRAIIYFSPIPPIDTGVSFRVQLFTIANLTEREKVSVVVKRGGSTIRHRVIDLEAGSSESTIVGEEGILTITISVPNKNFIYEPRMRTVFVPGSTRNDSIMYFDHFNLTRGQLKPSCCMASNDFTISCPGHTSQKISFNSSCKWTTRSNGLLTRSVGTVFAEGRDIFLPTSLSGLNYRTEGVYVNQLLPSNTQCETCDECDDGDSHECYCYTHTTDNTQKFLNARALTFTYITEILQLLPSWLQMYINLNLTLDSSPLTQHDMFAPVTRPMEQVSSIEGCSKLTGLENGVFSVMRCDKTLSAVIDDEQYEYRENIGTGRDGDTMCFAVDLCKGSESPVHIQISQPINDILVSEYLHRFAGRQWNIRFNTVTLQKQPSLHTSNITFWNGLSMIPVKVNVDVSVNVEVGLQLTDKSLPVGLQFSGTADLNHIVSFFLVVYVLHSLCMCMYIQESVGFLEGKFTLSVDTTINGVEQELQISSKDRTTAYYNIRGE